MDGPNAITVVYAYILEKNGTEVVPMIRVPEWDHQPGPLLLPLMGADLARAHALRRVILEAPELEGETLTLTKFTSREIVEVLKR